MKADASQIRHVVDTMYAEFMKKEQKIKSTPSDSKSQPRSKSPAWIIGTSLAVLLLLGVAIATFFVLPFVHPSTNTPSTPLGPSPPDPQSPSPNVPISSNPTLPPQSVFPSIDQKVLVEFYNATNGANWETKVASPSISACDWTGITCDDEFRVVEINMRDAYIKGSLPDSLGTLDKLRVLSLPDSYLHGTIPASIGNLTNLVELNFGNGQFSGSVPLEIFSLTLLEKLSLDYNNYLSWTIPPQIGNLKNLKELIAHNSGLHGTIPNEISQLTNLTALSLTRNSLTGTVPSLKNPKLRNLSLNYNNFTGSLPALPQLEAEQFRLNIEHNAFSGEFYLPLAILQQIWYLSIANNEFTSLSPEFDNFTQRIQFCNAAFNNFSCPIPDWFKNNCQATCI
jgi:Leucine-rich repeat (LRR) protein